MVKIIFLFICSIFFPIYAFALTDYELAAYYAPVIYQDTNNDDGTCWADFITNIDFDSNWIGNDNWDNTPYYPLKAYVYYYVVETSTHWFIGYSIFHPRDWSSETCSLWNCHENDLEGILVVVRKDGSTYGQLIAMETVAHWDFYQYANSGSGVSDGREDIDAGILLVEGTHPAISIQDEGHGIYSVLDGGSHVQVDANDPYYSVSFDGGDGVVYRYEGQAEIPSGCNARDVGYGLVSLIDTLWQFRFGPFGDGQLFGQSFVYDGGRLGKAFGDTAIAKSFDGDTYEDDSANTSWSWDDWDDGDVYAGDLAVDPAYTMDYHLSISGDYSWDYTYNPFLNMGGESLSFSPLTQYVTEVKAIHILELRPYIDKLRQRIGLSTYAWSQDVQPGNIIYGVDILELRSAIIEVYNTLNLPDKPAPTWSESLSRGIIIKLQHIQEIRDAISNIWNG